MLADYMKEISKIELLSLEEEIALWKAYETGDVHARIILIEHYQPLVFKEAMVYQQGSIDVMDCVQEGTVGLIEALERYDYRKGVAFSLFAIHRIRGRILDYLRKEGKMDRLWASEGDEVWWEQLPAEGPSTEMAVEEKVHGSLVSEALQQLPTQEKLVLEQVYMAHKSVATIADDLSCSNSYIHRLRRRGIERLRSLLGDIEKTWSNVDDV